MQKVLILLPSFDSGGAENFALRLIGYAGNEQFEWHVTSGNLRNAQLEPAFLAAGALTHHATTGFLSPTKALKFTRFLRAHEFDTVISFNGLFGGPAMRLAKLSGVPRRIAWHRRSSPAYQPTYARRLYAKQMLKWLERASTHILSNSRTALDYFHGANWQENSRFRVIPNGVDARRFRPRPELRVSIRAELGIPADAVVIGHIGRVDPAKDHETLLAAAWLLQERIGSVRLLLVGTGTDSENFHARVRNAGLADIYSGLGVRNDAERLYQAMDVFLFPSVTEGQPNVMIEAMLSEVPVVATRIGGIIEAVPESMQDRLVSPRNAGGLADRASQAFNTPKSELRSLRDWAANRFDMSQNLQAAIQPIVEAME